MTTLAYKDGVLAADSLVTSNSMRDGTTSRKIRKIGKLLVGGCGSLCEVERFMDWVKGGMEGDDPLRGGDSNGIVITPDKQVLLWSSAGPWKIDTDYIALGSGERFAMGAMAAGSSAQGAVEIALRFDVHSGGPIHFLSL